jgi:hypothetical protein
MASSENHKSVTIFESICADGTVEVPPAIINVIWRAGMMRII